METIEAAETPRKVESEVKRLTLLNKHNLAVALFASKEASRYTLQAIHVEPQGTTATDGHRHVRVSLPTMSAENYPMVKSFEMAEKMPTFLLSLDTVAKLLKVIPTKQTIPVLNHVAVGKVEEGRVQLAVTDLETDQVLRPRLAKGQFPNADVVISTKEPDFQITVRASYLMEMAKAAAQFTDSYNQVVKIKLWRETTETGVKPIQMEAKNSETGQTWTGMLMPCQE